MRMTRFLSATRLSALALPLALVACTKSSTGPTAEPDTWGTPISGGSMIVSQDGTRAIIADTDRDRIVIVQVCPTAP